MPAPVEGQDSSPDPTIDTIAARLGFRIVDGEGIVAAAFKRKSSTITAIRGVHSPSEAPEPSSVRDDG